MVYICTFKGHNKFSNIKHTKGAKDKEFSLLSIKYSREVGWAIRDNGMEKDPERNKKLAR